MTSSESAGGELPDHVAAMRELAGYWVQSQSVISAYLSANVFDPHHVEDLVQDVAQVCAEKFSTYDRGRPFVAWALGVARHRLLKYYRTRARDRLILSESALERLELALAKTEHEAEDRREAVRKCLRQVEGRRRQVLDLRYSGGVKVTDIAARLNMSPSGVSVMLHKVRAALFNCIRQELGRRRV